MKILIEGYRWFANALAILSGILLAAMTVGIGAEALIRATGMGVLRGVIDLSEHALFCIAILSAPWLLLRDGHLSVRVLVSHLDPVKQAIMKWLADLICLATCLVTFFVSGNVFLTSFARGQLIFQDIVIPDYWLQWQIPLSMALLSAAFAGRLVRPFLPRGVIDPKGYSHA